MMEFQTCVYWWLYTKKFGQHRCEILPTEREYDNLVDCYAVAMKKDSSDYDPSGVKAHLEVILLS